MGAISMRFGAALADLRTRIDWSAAWTWLLGFGLVSYLGLNGGGYDPLVHDQIGIAVWWVLLITLLVGAIPRRPLGPLAWGSLGLLGAFVAWTALSLGWTESIDRTFSDFARIAAYLGVFALALLTLDSRGSQRMIAAIAAAISLIALVGLLSRLHPGWFPEAEQTGRFLAGGQERLSYPVNYWNALGALTAIGFPLLLHVATSAKAILSRAVAAAVLPALALTAFLTLSRGGIGAGVVALLVFIACTSNRLPKLLSFLIAAGGATGLIIAAEQRSALQDGLLNSTAQQQGDEMLLIVVAVCLLVGSIQAALAWAGKKGMRPGWTVPSRRSAFAVAAVVSVAALVALAVVDAPGRAADGWAEFKEGGQAGEGSGRLVSFAGESRYLLWEAAADENASEPLAGTGSGTFEFWWNRNGEGTEVVRDTHSLYLQVFGELGVVGVALLGAFMLAIVCGGAYALMRAEGRARPQLAAALAGCVAFMLAAAVDWVWQVPVLPIAMLLLASTLFTARAEKPRRNGRWTLLLPVRIAFCLVTLAMIVGIAMPLAATTLLRQSEQEARDGDFAAALQAAERAQAVLPGAAPPRLQQALLLEGEEGSLRLAASAARGAAEREPTNWRNWLVLSRIEARRGRAAIAVRAFRRAKSLNPHFSLFQ